jgi:tetratricopeptide (TPR) repeat protein
MARLYLVGAQSFEQPGKLDQAIEWCQKSLAIAAQLKTREGQQIMAQAYTRLGSICLLRGYLDLVVHFCNEAIIIYQQISKAAGQINAYINLGIAYFNQGEWDKADQAYREGLSIAQMIGDIDGQSASHHNLALIYLERGDYEQALYLLEQSHTTWEQTGAIEDKAVALSNMAQVYLCQEKWDKAQSCLERSQLLLTKIEAKEYMPELERRWGEFYFKTGQFEPALAHTQRSIELAVEQGNPLNEGRSRRVLGQICLAINNQQLAKLALYQSLQILSNLNSKYEIAKTRLPLAHLMLEAGALDEAHTHLTRAIEIFKKLDAQVNLAEARNLELRLYRQF